MSAQVMTVEYRLLPRFYFHVAMILVGAYIGHLVPEITWLTGRGEFLWWHIPYLVTMLLHCGINVVGLMAVLLDAGVFRMKNWRERNDTNK